MTYLDGKLYVVTGYCDGDFVLTLTEEGGQWSWGSVAWGGKGLVSAQGWYAKGL